MNPAPLKTASGESIPDGPTGFQAVLRAIAESWPQMPRYSHDIAVAIGGTLELIGGGRYVRPNARAIYDALTAGVGAAEIRAALNSEDNRYILPR